jgi:hypothetical protein
MCRGFLFQYLFVYQIQKSAPLLFKRGLPMSNENGPNHILHKWILPIFEIVGVVGTLLMFLVMWQEFKILRKTQEISLRPYLTVEQGYQFYNNGKEDEIWLLSYAIHNSGQYPAVNVQYKIEESQTREFAEPSSYDNNNPIAIAGSANFIIASPRTLPRSEVIRTQAMGNSVCRHIYVKYKSNDGQEYHLQSTWNLTGYAPGVLPNWMLIKSEGN